MPEKEISDIDRAKVIIALANRVFGGRLTDSSVRPARIIYNSATLQDPLFIEEIVEKASFALGTISYKNDSESIKEHALRMKVLNEHYNLEIGRIIPLKKVAKKLGMLPIRARRLEDNILQIIRYQTPATWQPLEEVFNKYSR